MNIINKYKKLDDRTKPIVYINCIWFCYFIFVLLLNVFSDDVSEKQLMMNTGGIVFELGFTYLLISSRYKDVKARELEEYIEKINEKVKAKTSERMKG